MKDGVKAKRPVVSCNPTGKGVCAGTSGSARRPPARTMWCLMADMFGRLMAPTEDAGRAARRHAAVHKDLPSRSLVGGKAHDTLLPKRGQLGSGRWRQKSAANRLLCGRRSTYSNRRAPAAFAALVVFHVTNPNPVVAGTPCNIRRAAVLAIPRLGDP